MDFDKNLISEFEGYFGKKPAVISRAPGRLEILGNHTDYNEGFVLSCAVSCAVTVVMAENDLDVCRLRDPKYDKDAVYTFSLDDIDTAIPGDWTNYVKGVIVELRKRGKDVKNFDALLYNTVPMSAGMSSSAALEVGFSFAFKELFGLEFSNEEWARIGQGVENNYMGLKTGLLDQFSSIFCKKNALILSDFRTVEVLRPVAVPPGYSFVVANSMVKHDLVDSEYNVRRADCEGAAAKLNKVYAGAKTLRDITPAQLEESKALLTTNEYKRAAHVVGECDRVKQAVTALDNSDVATFGKLLFESHESSKVNFENSTVELDYLVELAKSLDGALGARLSGGGFGGISIHLVENSKITDYTQKLSAAFKLQHGVDPQIIVCEIGQGAEVVKL